MGWLFQNTKLRQETPAAYFTRLFTYDSQTMASIVIAAAAVRSTVYAAVRHRDKLTGVSYVYCAVILFKNSNKDGFGYKDMDESAGPCEVDCPDRIMRLLSPVAELPHSKYAADWRARVEAHKARDATARTRLGLLRPGQVIALHHPVSFERGTLTVSRFRFLRMHKRTPIFEPTDRPGFRCRLTKYLLATATWDQAAGGRGITPAE